MQAKNEVIIVMFGKYTAKFANFLYFLYYMFYSVIMYIHIRTPLNL